MTGSFYDFLVNPDHHAQPGHAKLFSRLFGIDRTNAEQLRVALLSAARNLDVESTRLMSFGTMHKICFPMAGVRRTHRIISVWIIRRGEEHPRLVTAYPEKQRHA